MLIAQFIVGVVERVLILFQHENQQQKIVNTQNYKLLFTNFSIPTRINIQTKNNSVSVAICKASVAGHNHITQCNHQE
nr:hypothetical protein CFP56_45824 [Quercus suber]